MKYVFRLLIIHIVLMFAASMLVSLAWTVPQAGEMSGNFRAVRGVLWFFDIFPAGLIAAYTVGFSIGFGRLDEKKIPGFSGLMFKHFQSAVIVALVLALFAMGTAEFAVPMIKQWQTHSVLRGKYYDEYLDLAGQYMELGQYELALLDAKNALSFVPDSAEAKRLEEQATIALVNRADTENMRLSDILAADTAATGLPLIENYAVDELVAQATEAFTAGSWFDAHYFATLAISASGLSGAETQEMKRISDEAWEKLSAPQGAQDDDARDFYLTKKAGYTALLNGDSGTAYYIFHGLLKTHPKETDVERWSAVAEQKLLTSYFFLDEITDLAYFETAKDVSFSLPRPDGGQDIVFIHGITSLKNSGGFVQYLRLFRINSYDADGRFVQQIQAPVAKLIEFQDGRPFLLLEGLDRDKEGVVSAPIYTPAPADGTIPHTMFLDLPFKDLLQIIEASFGVETMAIPSLYTFIPKTARYGFSSEVYLQTLMSRLGYPFVLLILFLVFAILAWNYRIEKTQPIRFMWFALLPVLTGVIFFVLQGSVYLEKIINYALIGLFPAYAPVMFIAVFALMILALSFRFLALKTND